MNTLTGDRYRLGNKMVHRVGYGAMQLAGAVSRSTRGSRRSNRSAARGRRCRCRSH